MNKMKLLFLDIETFPIEGLVWNLWDQNIALNQIIAPDGIFCWAAKWKGQREVFFDSLHASSKKKMLTGIHSLLNEADAVCHYNGNSFDIPILNREFLKAEIAPPAPSKKIDLYQTMKRVFKFPSNKLEWIARELGIGEKVKHEGMPLWRACMAGDDRAWARMEKYNKQDVRLTERLYTRILPWIANHPNVALYGDLQPGELVCPRCGGKDFQKRGFSTTMTLVYARYRCKGCGKWVRGRRAISPVDKERPVLVDLPQ